MALTDNGSIWVLGSLGALSLVAGLRSAGSSVRLGPLFVPERTVTETLRAARAHREAIEKALKKVRVADTDRRAELGRQLVAAEADVVWWRHQVFDATDADHEPASRYTREAVAARTGGKGSPVRLGEIYKPPEYANGHGPWTSIRQLELANAAAGMFFFSKENMRFHNSRVMGPLYGGRYFVTSEKVSVRFSEHPLPHPRLYTVRRASDDADIDAIGKHGQYTTLNAARRAAQVAAAAELRAAAMASRRQPAGNEHGAGASMTEDGRLYALGAVAVLAAAGVARSSGSAVRLGPLFLKSERRRCFAHPPPLDTFADHRAMLEKIRQGDPEACWIWGDDNLSYPSKREAERAAQQDYLAVRGRRFWVENVNRAPGDDVEHPPGIWIEVVGTADADILNWNGTWLDPHWNVNVLSPSPVRLELEGPVWIYGRTYTLVEP